LVGFGILVVVVTEKGSPPWELFGVDKRDPPIGSLEDIGNGFVRSITRNLRTGEVVVKEYEADIDLL